MVQHPARSLYRRVARLGQDGHTRGELEKYVQIWYYPSDQKKSLYRVLYQILRWRAYQCYISWVIQWNAGS